MAPELNLGPLHTEHAHMHAHPHPPPHTHQCRCVISWWGSLCLYGHLSLPLAVRGISEQRWHQDRTLSNDHRRLAVPGLTHILCKSLGHSTDSLPGCKSRILTFVKHREQLKTQMRFQKMTLMKLFGNSLISWEAMGGGVSPTPEGAEPTQSLLWGCGLCGPGGFSGRAACTPLSIFENSITTCSGLDGGPGRDTS